MKNFYLVCMALLAGFIASSCTQDDTIVENSVRDTQTDMEILSRFIDINETTNEYYINENKKTRALSYVTNSDFEELEKVSPVNIEKCQMELNALNAQVGKAMADPNIAYMVFSVNGKTLVKNLRDANFGFEVSNEQVVSTRSLPYPLDIYGGQPESTTGQFMDASRTIRMSVELNPSVSFGYYFFQVLSPDATVDPDDSILTPTSVAFSGTGQLWNNQFTWTAYWDVQQPDGQFKWEFRGKGTAPDLGHIATCSFSY